MNVATNNNWVAQLATGNEWLDSDVVENQVVTIPRTLQNHVMRIKNTRNFNNVFIIGVSGAYVTFNLFQM